MKVSKIFIGFFVIVQILFGLDFGFTILFAKKLRFLSKCFCLLFSFFIMAIMFVNIYINSFQTLNMIVTLEFVLYFISLTTAKYTVCDFLVDFSEIDSYFNIDSKMRVISNLHTLAYMISVLWFKILVSVLYCNLSLTPEWCEIPMSRVFFYALPYLSLDVPLVVQSLIFYIPYCCLRLLELELIKNKCNVCDILKIYKQIADVVDKIKPVFDRLFLIGMLINVPKFMYFVYRMLRYFAIHEDWLTFWLEYLYTARIVVLLCIPSVIAELVAAVPDRMKLELNNRLLEMYGGIDRRDVKKLLQYIEARPLNYKVWRIIPIDLHLPIYIFSMCTTYLVFIVQFTHLYD